MKELHLSNNRIISGVCWGIAEYFEIDPSIIRLAWIVVTVLTGIVPGVIAYILAAIVIPRSPTE